MVLIKEGQDIRCVTSSSRNLAQKLTMALIARDRTCVIKGCGKRLGIEFDHCFIDYIDDGPTTYDNMARLCAGHHHQKTHGGWILRRGPNDWTLEAPPDPPSSGALSRARRLAAAKAKAGILRSDPKSKSLRDHPRQQ